MNCLLRRFLPAPCPSLNRLTLSSPAVAGMGLSLLMSWLSAAGCSPTSSRGPQSASSGSTTAASQPAGSNSASHANTTYPASPTTKPPLESPSGVGKSVPVERYILVDQFGYLPTMDKFAILVDPQKGWNAAESYIPPKEMEVRLWRDGSLATTVRVTPWEAGAIDKTSGDRGSWVNFTKLDEPGLYYLYDAKNGVRSHAFEIAEDVYAKVLKTAFRAFYFNRANVAKISPFACQGDRCWEHKADNVGPRQDKEARSITDPDNSKTARNLSGGWWDAGDTNKYVPSSNEAVHQLLTAFSESPKVFTDEFGLPESGNGLPDIIDELLVEFHWLEKMQPEDLKGGTLLKVGHLEEPTTVPEKSELPRYYYPEPCSSASVTVASQFAHGALIFRQFPQLRQYATALKQRAESAWKFYHEHPKSDACDDGRIQAGDADQTLEWQAQTAVTAAVYLFSLTHQQQYSEYVSDHYLVTLPFKDDQWSVDLASQGDALVYYSRLKRGESSTKLAIRKRKMGQSESIEIYRMRSSFDLYRSYMRPGSFTMGSNLRRAGYGNTNYDLVQHRWVKGPADQKSFTERAAGMLHSFHGVNPMQIAYLTNMYAVGGDASADEIYHSWFRNQDPDWDNARTSKMGPAPGFVPSGPNHEYCQSFSSDHACTQSPILDQPVGKAYVDTNLGWAPESEFDKAWELTEPSISIQAAYIRLVSKFVP